MRHKSTLTENDSNLVIEMYNSGMYIKDIASSFHCRVTKITDILHNAGIRTNNEGKYLNRLVNTTYFDVIDSEAKAYLLGFITADGSVGVRAGRGFGKTLRLELQESDESILDLLSDELNIKSKKYYRNKNGKITVSVSISSTEIVDSLEKYGVVANKTYVLESLFMDLPDDLLRAYLRGLFDGDGSLYISSGIVHGNFTEGLEHIVVQFRDIINSKIGIENTTKIQCNNGVYHAVWNGSNCVKLCGYLYKDAKYFLPRKYEFATTAIKSN